MNYQSKIIILICLWTILTTSLIAGEKIAIIGWPELAERLEVQLAQDPRFEVMERNNLQVLTREINLNNPLGSVNFLQTKIPHADIFIILKNTSNLPKTLTVFNAKNCIKTSYVTLPNNLAEAEKCAMAEIYKKNNPAINPNSKILAIHNYRHFAYSYPESAQYVSNYFLKNTDLYVAERDNLTTLLREREISQMNFHVLRPNIFINCSVRNKFENDSEITPEYYAVITLNDQNNNEFFAISVLLPRENDFSPLDKILPEITKIINEYQLPPPSTNLYSEAYTLFHDGVESRNPGQIYMAAVMAPDVEFYQAKFYSSLFQLLADDKINNFVTPDFQPEYALLSAQARIERWQKEVMCFLDGPISELLKAYREQNPPIKYPYLQMYIYGSLKHLFTIYKDCNYGDELKQRQEDILSSFNAITFERIDRQLAALGFTPDEVIPDKYELKFYRAVNFKFDVDLERDYIPQDHFIDRYIQIEYKIYEAIYTWGFSEYEHWLSRISDQASEGLKYYLLHSAKTAQFIIDHQISPLVFNHSGYYNLEENFDVMTRYPFFHQKYPRKFVLPKVSVPLYLHRYIQTSGTLKLYCWGRNISITGHYPPTVSMRCNYFDALTVLAVRRGLSGEAPFPSNDLDNSCLPYYSKVYFYLDKLEKLNCKK